jgi:hypothetical protein
LPICQSSWVAMRPWNDARVPRYAPRPFFAITGNRVKDIIASH